ncbi:unnamed protein product [Closterium sp. NIES-64]|nr:unnamed protein product [Closterium sp. NIES-64]
MFHGPTHSHGKVREDEKVVRGSERTGIMCDPRLSLRTLLVPLPRPPLRFPRPPVRQWGMPTDLAAVALLAQATFEATQKSHGSRGSTGAGGGRLSIQRGGLQLRDTVNAVIRQRRQRRFNEAIMCLRPQRQSSSPLISSLFRPLSRLSHPLPPSPALSSPLPPSSPSPPISPPFPPLFPSLPPTQAEAVQRGNNVSAPAAALLPAAGRNEGPRLWPPPGRSRGGEEWSQGERDRERKATRGHLKGRTDREAERSEAVGEWGPPRLKEHQRPAPTP